MASTNATPLDEESVMNGFHTFLTNALAQAKAERLLDEETLASAEADLMVSGPALCLYFAALRSSTDPPSVPIPRSSAPPGTPPIVLSAETCPPAFRAFFSIWAATVPVIQGLPSEQKHDLARIICGRDPLSASSARQDASKRLAADLRAVTIEISQRRTFQERYQADLQAALDHGRPVTPDGRRTPSPLRATFVPPPGYDVSNREKPLPVLGSTQSTPGRSSRQLPPTQGMHVVNADASNGRRPTTQSSTSVPNSPNLPATDARRTAHGHTRNQSSGQYLELPGSTSAAAGPSRLQRSPTLLSQQDPAIFVIRETLYAALGDVLARTPELRFLLKSDPGRAYFASVGLAILEFSLTSLTPQGGIKSVLGAELTLEECPPDYRPLMMELQRIAVRSRELEKEDNDRAVELLSASEDPLPEPRMERVRKMLVKGVAKGWEELQAEGTVSDEEAEAMNEAGAQSQRRRMPPHGRQRRPRAQSPAGTALELTNRINALALGMVRLPAFRERQDKIFKVLAGVR